MGDRTQFKTRKQVEVWKNDYEWFISTHQDASFSWLMCILLHSYREVCENPKDHNLSTVTPTSTTEEAGTQIKNELEDGLHKE